MGSEIEKLLAMLMMTKAMSTRLLELGVRQPEAFDLTEKAESKLKDLHDLYRDVLQEAEYACRSTLG